MKIIRVLFLIAFTGTITNCTTIKSGAEMDKANIKSIKEYYQLKVFTLKSTSQVKVIDAYLEEAYLPALKRLNINNVGVFKPHLNETDTIQKIYVLIPFKSIEQFLELSNKLAKDNEYLVAGSDYLNASNEQPPYERIETTLMTSFTDFPYLRVPKLSTPKKDRVYELRSYESPTDIYYKNKVDMFNAGGETKLFDRLGFNAVFYGEVISGAKMPNLMYLTTFSDKKSRDAHWDNFVESPEWKRLSSMEKYKNTVSHADIMLLYPTEYSDY